MKTSDVVFVFKMYDLLSENVFDLLKEKKYNVATIVSYVTRVNGARTYYAADILKRKDDGKSEMYVNTDTSNIRDNETMFISRIELFKFLEKYASSNPERRGEVSNLIFEINAYFLQNGLEVVIPNNRFDTYGGTET